MSLVVLLYLFHYLVFCIPQPFFIEDAGISFAYARNAAMGEGFVGYPGGERVEGFSNPLWTFTLSALYFFGLDPWTSSKILGAVFGSLALCSVYGISRRMKLEGLLDICSSTYACFINNLLSGIPRALAILLYAFLLCTGMLRLLHEDEADGTFPISALCFFWQRSLGQKESCMVWSHWSPRRSFPFQSEGLVLLHFGVWFLRFLFAGIYTGDTSILHGNFPIRTMRN